MLSDSIYTEKLRDAVKTVSYFVENVPGGCSYWIDEKGTCHTADMGYVCEFLDDLEEYLETRTSDTVRKEGFDATKN